MIYFINEPLIGGGYSLTVIETAQKKRTVSFADESALFEFIDNRSKSYWTKYIIDKFYLYTSVDIKERSRIITDLHRLVNTIDIVNIFLFDAIPLLYKEDLTDTKRKELEACESWANAFKMRRKAIDAKNGQNIHNISKSITFENEPNRPSISEIFNIKR